METVLPRRCETCLFHQCGPTAATGRCGHPDRQPRAGMVVPLVRARELACYQGWGRDSWQPAPEDVLVPLQQNETAQLVAEIEERVLGWFPNAEMSAAGVGGRNAATATAVRTGRLPLFDDDDWK